MNGDRWIKRDWRKWGQAIKMKIFFTDLDDTLLNEKGQVSEYTRDVVRRFIAAGNKFVLASGRPIGSILQVKESAGLELPGIYITAYNGCLVYDCDAKENILELRVPIELVDVIQSEAIRRGIHIQTYTLNEVVSPQNDEEIKYYRKKVQLPLIISPKLSEGIDQAPYKMLSIHLYDHEYHNKFADYISKNYGDKIETLFSNNYYLEMFNKNGGKGNAVRFLCKYLNIPLENSYAAGDADNDISMILAAGTGVAMLNASDNVKQAADCITEFDFRNDGLAKYIEKIL